MDVGAEAFVARRPEVPALLAELGLGERQIGTTGARPLIYSQRRLHPMPTDTMQGIPAQPRRSPDWWTTRHWPGSATSPAARSLAPRRRPRGRRADLRPFRRPGGDPFGRPAAGGRVRRVVGHYRLALGTSDAGRGAGPGCAQSDRCGARRAAAASLAPGRCSVRSMVAMRCWSTSSSGGLVSAGCRLPSNGSTARSGAGRSSTTKASATTPTRRCWLSRRLDSPAYAQEVAPRTAAAARRIGVASSALVALALPGGTPLPHQSGVLVASGERLRAKAITLSSENGVSAATWSWCACRTAGSATTLPAARATKTCSSGRCRTWQRCSEWHQNPRTVMSSDGSTRCRSTGRATANWSPSCGPVCRRRWPSRAPTWTASGCLRAWPRRQGRPPR